MTFFFSDVHLGLGDPGHSREREQRLVRFLDALVEARAERVFIVGDLFDYWFDYRTAVPRNFTRTLGALARLADSGTSVEYLIGNHDFGHRDYFESELGITVHTGDIERMLEGRRCYIAHGDGKAFNDTGYLILRKILRARLSGFLFRGLHPDIGIGVASWASRRSRAHTLAKYYGDEKTGESDGLSAFARKKLEEENYDLVVMGHSHTIRQVRYGNGLYINLGTWLKEPTYLALDETVCELRRFSGRALADDEVIERGSVDRGSTEVAGT